MSHVNKAHDKEFMSRGIIDSFLMLLKGRSCVVHVDTTEDNERIQLIKE